MSNKFSLSVILPTFREKKNLEIIIPEIIEKISSLNYVLFEILVVDDNSNDGTIELIENLNKKYKNLRILVRNGPNSLPNSILDGIKNSNNDFVMWLDADGSMPANEVRKLIEVQLKNFGSVVVGSRFVEGGGYKGTVLNEDNKIRKAIFNVYKSNDSVIAMLLSLLFNYLLSILSSVKVKDLTSGFIIGDKKMFNDECFLSANYGDYFVYLMKDLNHKNVPVLEVGYKCQTRIYGVSKTGSSLMQLVKLGVPYIKAAIK